MIRSSPGCAPRNSPRHDAIYFGLSTFQNQSPCVVGALIDAMDGGEREDAHRARWGLRSGVQEESHQRVADAALRLLEARGEAG